LMERRVLADGVRVLVPAGFEADGFMVAFTERAEGVSEEAFRSLNLGLRCGDDPASALENRRRVCGGLGIPNFSLVRQVHSATVVKARSHQVGAGFADPAGALGNADAIVTRSRQVPVAVLTADCVPVVLADPATGQVAVVHAGWRGVAQGVLRSALDCFPDPAVVRAAVGPAIGPDHYEVGEDVAAAVSSACPEGALTHRSNGRLLLDLPGTVCRSLAGFGVRGVDREEVCTACEPERFFSHRRDGVTGRQGVVAMRR
jgi:purine-nucleoside/S-methyl-5'-thioadenosine phosphorylase / adenosine deaminase